jgi:hypothetical protein
MKVLLTTSRVAMVILVFAENPAHMDGKRMWALLHGK